jgi:WD40 repeat protein
LIAAVTFAGARSCSTLDAHRVPPAASSASPVAPDPLTTAMRRLAAGDLEGATSALDRAALRSAAPADVLGVIAEPAWSADGSRVAFRMGRAVRVFDASTGREVGAEPTPGLLEEDEPFPLTFALSPDGSRLAVRRPNERADVELWDPARAVKIASFATDVVVGDLAFSPDGATVAFTSQEGAGSRVGNQITIVNARTGELRCIAKYERQFGSLGFEAGGALLRLGSRGFRSDDCAALPEEAPISFVQGPGSSGVVGGSDGFWAIPAGRRPPPRVYDKATRTDLGPLQAPGCEHAEGAVAGPDGAPLVTYEGATLCVWDLPTRALLRRIEVPFQSEWRSGVLAPEAMRFTSDGRGLVIGVATHEGRPRVHAHILDLEKGSEVEDLGRVHVLGHTARHLGAPLPAGDVWLYDPDRGELLRVHAAATAERVSVAFRGDEFVEVRRGGQVAKTDATGLRLIDTAHAAVRTLRAGPGEWKVRFSEDLTRLAGQSDGGEARVWDVATGEPLFLASTAPRSRPVAALGFTPDGATLVVATVGGGEERLTLATSELHSQKDIGSPHLWGPTVAITTEGSVVAASEEHGDIRVTIRPATSGAPARVVPLVDTRGGELVGPLALSPDGTLGAVYTLTNGADFAETHLFDTKTGKRKRKLSRIASTVIAFDPRGTRFATGSSLMGGVEVWDMTTGKNRAEIQDVRPEAVAFSPDGRLLAFTTPDGFHLVDLGPDPSSAAHAAHPAALVRELCAITKAVAQPIVFSADGARVLAMRGLRPIFLDARNCAVLDELPALPEEPAALTIHPDGKLVAAGTHAGDLLLLGSKSRTWLSVAMVPGGAAAFANGKVELLGHGGQALARCVVRGLRFPLEMCDDRVVTRGIVARSEEK